MKQKLLLSELDLKKLRDKVQHLQNELIRVSWGWGWGRGPGEQKGRELGGVQSSVWEQKGERHGGKGALRWKAQRRGQG